MGKRGGKKRDHDAGMASSSGLHASLSLREEASGKKQSHNPKSLLKLKHLQNLAEWATREASIPSLGAFFGSRFAEFGEALGIRPDPSLFPCQRCETLLHPGFNCSVRIEKNKAKRRHRRGKTNPPTQNNVVYTCNFCSHRNLKRGTPKWHIREICPSKTNLPSNQRKAETPTAPRSNNEEKNCTQKVEAEEAIERLPSTVTVTNSLTETPATSAKLLDSNRSKRKKAGPKGSADQSLVGLAPAAADAKNASSTSASRKRKKSWTTLKEIAKNEELERNKRFQKLPVPFHL